MADEPQSLGWLVGGETQEGIQPYWVFRDREEAHAYAAWCAETAGPRVVVIDVVTGATDVVFETTGRAA